MKEESLDHCERNNFKHHFWERVGNVDYDYIIYICSQCHKCKLVKIKYLSGNKIEEYNFEKEKFESKPYEPLPEPQKKKPSSFIDRLKAASADLERAVKDEKDITRGFPK